MTDLLNLLKVSQVDEDIYQSYTHQTNPKGSLFGGQIIAQGLCAARKTVALYNKELSPHSIHCYFLEKGNNLSPVQYKVKNLRNGKSFSVFSVEAMQDEKIIFICNISFHIKEKGLQYFQELESIPKVPNEQDFEVAKKQYQFSKLNKTNIWINPNHNLFDLIPVDCSIPIISGDVQNPEFSFWVRSKDIIDEDNTATHQAALAVASDMGILFASLAPHKINIHKIFVASIDHSIWFHQNTNMNQWNLIRVSSPWSGHGRGLVFAHIYNEQGILIASITQEGLIRILGIK